MKKIYCLLVLFAAACINISCTGEVDDIFDKSASERIEDAIKSDTEILTSAANGWVMYYYGNKNYGGYNVLCKFNKDNTVNVASEFYESKEVIAKDPGKLEERLNVIDVKSLTILKTAQRLLSSWRTQGLVPQVVNHHLN